MKETTSIKSVLGLSQDEMAMLLGVTRVQWALFNTGKRGISLEATQKLGDVLVYINKNNSVSTESIKIAEAEKKKKHEWLKREYRSLEIKKNVLERKINTMENIRKECFAALEVVHYLESNPEKETIPGVAQSIKIRVSQSLNKNSLKQLQELKLKKESLQILQLNIEEELKL